MDWDSSDWPITEVSSKDKRLPAFVAVSGVRSAAPLCLGVIVDFSKLKSSAIKISDLVSADSRSVGHELPE